MRYISKTVILFLSLILCAMCAIPTVAFADTYVGNTPYRFEFYDDTTTELSEHNACKRDGEQQWYISLHSYNQNLGRYNTVSATNIFGARLNKVGNISDTIKHNNIGGYRIHTEYKTYAWSYLYPATMDMYFFLGAKKDDTSSSSTALYVSGNYCP